MINSMTYKGYTASMVFDAEDKVIVGRVLDIDDIISFHGESVTEFESNFCAAIEDYLAASKELGSAAKKAGQWQSYAAHCARGPCCSPQGCGEKRYQSKQMGRGSTGSGNSKTKRSGCGAKRSLNPSLRPTRCCRQGSRRPTKPREARTSVAARRLSSTLGSRIFVAHAGLPGLEIFTLCR